MADLSRIAYLSALAIILAAVFIWHYRRFVRPQSPVLSACQPPTPEDLAFARNALVHRFMQWLKSHAVQQLIAQREELIATQQLAQAELGKLERMFVETQAPLQDRLRHYEQRIAQLEQALNGKGEEYQALIESIIRQTRQQLEPER